MRHFQKPCGFVQLNPIIHNTYFFQQQFNTQIQIVVNIFTFFENVFTSSCYMHASSVTLKLESIPWINMNNWKKSVLIHQKPLEILFIFFIRHKMFSHIFLSFLFSYFSTYASGNLLLWNTPFQSIIFIWNSFPLGWEYSEMNVLYGKGCIYSHSLRTAVVLLQVVCIILLLSAITK